MANHLLSAFACLISATCMSAQEAPERDGDLPVVVSSGGLRGEPWIPVVALWLRDDDKRRSEIEQALKADGFGVVNIDSVSLSDESAGSKRLASLLAAVRRKTRVAQGGMHVVIASDPKLAIEAVLRERQEFQTVTVCGDAAGANLDAVRKLPKRRVTALATHDAAAISGYVKSLHEERVVKGVAGDVHRVLDSFHDAAAVADEDRYFAILPDDSVFLGTDATERWTGKQFRSFAMRYFKLPSAWTYVPLERNVTMSPDGKLAWFDEALDNSSYGECRGTGVLTKRDGRWVILQYNLTVPVPNDLMGGFAKKIRAHLDGVKPVDKKPVDKKPAAKKPAARKSAARKPSARKPDK